MNTIAREDLRALAEKQYDLAISIFMPTHQTLPDRQQDPIRLKNLIDQAKDEMVSRSTTHEHTQRIFEPVETLFANLAFWEHLSRGLALFLSNSDMKIYRVPIDLREQVIISEYFHIRPLLPVMERDRKFYVLSLSENEVHLYEANSDQIQELDLGDTPKSMAAALRYDDPQRQLQWHTKTSEISQSGERRGMFHGHSEGQDFEKTNYLRFFQILNDGVTGVLSDKTDPLVLAGVDYLLPIYREANTYPHLMAEGIEGSPKVINADKLHQKAWKIVSQNIDDRLDFNLGRYYHFKEGGAGPVSDNMQELVRDAYYGRVEVLFVRDDIQHWGRFDETEFKVVLHDQKQSGDRDLIDFAAVHTLSNGGSVYSIGPEKMPGGTTMAAILRY